MSDKLLPPALWLLIAATASAQTADQWTAARKLLVDRDIVGAGIKNTRGIDAMRSPPRHEFVPADQRHFAYFDMSLPIGEHQTVSPPFMVAYMTERLQVEPTHKVLEIGTGSGHHG